MKPGRHICTVCNAIYEEPNEKLDTKKASFDSLPEDWKCECGAGKDKFQPCSCVSVTIPSTTHEHEDSCTQKTK
ncbi:MAG: rubredoxin [Cyanobacteria bacterium SZAS TMP-1]|nr:rubredoxin [Cyanobacteria bacterium SZAS TMP-1]